MTLFPNRKISIRLIIKYFGVFIFLCAAATQAAVYKWTDAQGKVHYSDQKVDDKASEQSVAVGRMPPATIVPVAQPEKYKSNTPSKWLSVTEINFNLPADNSGRINSVNFYFGGDCVSPTSMGMGEFLKRYRKNLDSGYELQKASAAILSTIGYRNILFNEDDPARKVENNEGYILRLDIVNIKINGCVPRLRTPQDSGALDKFGFSSYERSNVWLKLKWSIENGKQDKVIASGYSDGSANDVDGQDAGINYTFKLAYLNSFTNAIASPEFMEVLNASPSIAGAAANLGARPKMEATSDTKQSGLSALPKKMEDSYVARANFAKALMLVNPLRMSIANYYAERGEWPVYFTDINVDAKELREPGVVEFVTLRVGGRLRVVLAEESFGAKHYFELTPKVRSSAIDWECKTSLDKALWVGSCTGY